MIRTPLVREIAVVIAVASALGILFNAKYNPKPIPWVHQERVVNVADDGDLPPDLPPGSAPSDMKPTPTPEQTGTTPTVDSAKMREKKRLDSLKALKHSKDSLAKAAQGNAPNPATAQGGAKLPPNNDLMVTKEHEVKLPISVSYEQVLKLMNNPTVQFIDARKAAEYALGHIGNAFNMDMVEANSEASGMNKIMQRAYQIPSDKPVVVYCGGGNCELSHELCDALIQRGLKKVYIYLGGWGEYSEKQGIKK